VGLKKPGMQKPTGTKKAKLVSGPRMGVKAPKTVEEYLARVPEPARTTLNKVRAMIRAVVPAEAAEGISYGIPTFKYNGGLVAFAAFKDHCSFFSVGFVSTRCVQERTQRLPCVERYAPLPAGQASACYSREKDREGPRRAE